MNKGRDRNDILTLLLEELMPYFQTSVNCFQIGKVVRFDGKNADVQPLARQSDGSKRPIVGNCLVTKQAGIYRQDKKDVALKKGDVVIVGFHDRDLDNFHGSSEFTLASRRMHSESDGIVLGVIIV